MNECILNHMVLKIAAIETKALLKLVETFNVSRFGHRLGRSPCSIGFLEALDEEFNAEL